MKWLLQVLNMKPHEILGMIEEAAGTRMFENKKQVCVLTVSMQKQHRYICGSSSARWYVESE
jgi:hypothetical protein